MSVSKIAYDEGSIRRDNDAVSLVILEQLLKLRVTNFSTSRVHAYSVYMYMSSDFPRASAQFGPVLNPRAGGGGGGGVTVLAP